MPVRQHNINQPSKTRVFGIKISITRLLAGISIFAVAAYIGYSLVYPRMVASQLSAYISRYNTVADAISRTGQEIITTAQSTLRGDRNEVMSALTTITAQKTEIEILINKGDTQTNSLERALNADTDKVRGDIRDAIISLQVLLRSFLEYVTYQVCLFNHVINHDGQYGAVISRLNSIDANTTPSQQIDMFNEAAVTIENARIAFRPEGCFQGEMKPMLNESIRGSIDAQDTWDKKFITALQQTSSALASGSRQRIAQTKKTVFDVSSTRSLFATSVEFAAMRTQPLARLSEQSDMAKNVRARLIAHVEETRRKYSLPQ